jgi:hypothetical protein
MAGDHDGARGAAGALPARREAQHWMRACQRSSALRLAWQRAGVPFFSSHVFCGSREMSLRQAGIARCMGADYRGRPRHRYPGGAARRGCHGDRRGVIPCSHHHHHPTGRISFQVPRCTERSRSSQAASSERRVARDQQGGGMALDIRPSVLAALLGSPPRAHCLSHARPICDPGEVPSGSAGRLRCVDHRRR